MMQICCWFSLSFVSMGLMDISTQIIEPSFRIYLLVCLYSEISFLSNLDILSRSSCTSSGCVKLSHPIILISPSFLPTISANFKFNSSISPVTEFATEIPNGAVSKIILKRFSLLNSSSCFASNKSNILLFFESNKLVIIANIIASPTYEVVKNIGNSFSPKLLTRVIPLIPIEP